MAGAVGLLAGCSPVINRAALISLPGSMSLALPAGAVSQRNGTGVVELGVVKGSGAPGDDGLWGGSVSGHGVLWDFKARRAPPPPRFGLGLITHGRLDAGGFRDELYGHAGFDAGPALVMGRVSLGAQLGYTYGGYTATGHQVGARLALIADGGWVALRGSLGGSWWLGASDAPASAEAFGPGWRVRGGDVGVLFGRTVAAGVTLAATREDDVTISTVLLSIGVRRSAR
ncbi:MAG: hypothetical protein R2939_10635 [Kofleriaceae bacterium]